MARRVAKQFADRFAQLQGFTAFQKGEGGEGIPVVAPASAPQTGLETMDADTQSDFVVAKALEGEQDDGRSLSEPLRHGLGFGKFAQ